MSDLGRIIAWAGIRAETRAVLAGASPDTARELAATAGPGGLVVVDPDPGAVDALRAHLAAAGRAATVLDGDQAALPVLSRSVEVAWVEADRAGDVAAALAEAIRVTRPGGTVVMCEAERAGEPPLRQAERLADRLALAGLADVRTLVALGLAAPASGDPTGQVAASLVDGLADVRVLRVKLTVAAAGTVRP